YRKLYAKGEECMISYVLKNDRYEMKVPALTFGAAGFERNDCDDVYFEFLDKYVELGGWCIDTARVYCDCWRMVTIPAKA
ncbi:MAG: hypothetical protein U0K24_08050, partial [Lachnospiraceae bacterium]|nr:hypothetical protein [Lachnospiraceae bacterium]